MSDGSPTVMDVEKYITEAGELQALWVSVSDGDGGVHNLYYIMEDGNPNLWVHNGGDQIGKDVSKVVSDSQKIEQIATQEVQRQVNAQQ